MQCTWSEVWSLLTYVVTTMPVMHTIIQGLIQWILQRLFDLPNFLRSISFTKNEQLLAILWLVKWQTFCKWLFSAALDLREEKAGIVIQGGKGTDHRVRGKATNRCQLSWHSVSSAEVGLLLLDFVFLLLPDGIRPHGWKSRQYGAIAWGQLTFSKCSLGLSAWCTEGAGVRALSTELIYTKNVP